MRRAVPLLLAALLAGGLALAAAHGSDPSSTPAHHPADDAPAAEVGLRALLPRALEEASAYDQGWELAGASAIESARPVEWDIRRAPDPRPGNGLAPEWLFVFTGPDGMAHVGLAASGERFAVGWMAHAPAYAPPALGSWALDSAQALDRARADPALAAALDAPGLQLHLDLARAPPEGQGWEPGADRSAWEPWWMFRASQGPDAREPGTAFRVHAVTGEVRHEPGPTMLEGTAPPPAYPEPYETTTPIARDGWLDAWYPADRFVLDGAGGAAGRASLDLHWSSTADLPTELRLRVLDESLDAVAEVAGAAPLHLEADFAAGFVYVEVSFADGQLPLSTTYHLTGLATYVVDPMAASAAWSASSSGSLDPLHPAAGTSLIVDRPGSALHAVAVLDGTPASTEVALRLLDGQGNVLAEAIGSGNLALDVEGLVVGGHLLELEMLGPGLVQYHLEAVVRVPPPS